MLKILLDVLETIQRDSTISFPFLGDWTINPPSYITVFGKDIYLYGIMIATGFILGILFCSKRSRSFGIDSDDVYDLMIWIIPLSIIGARLYFVAFQWDYYSVNPDRIIAVWEGGLAIYGGVIAGIITLLLYCRKKKIPAAAMLDLLVFGLLIGQILGRWGNFFNREAFGAETDVFCKMGLTSPSGTTIYVHPTFLYESLWNLAGFIFLLIFTGKGKRRYDGQCFLIYFFWYGIGRFWIEGLRTDSLYIGHSSIRVSQLLSAVMVLIAGIFLLVNSRKQHAPEALWVNRAAGDADGSTEDGEAAESAETEDEQEDTEPAEDTEEKNGGDATDTAPAEDGEESAAGNPESAEEAAGTEKESQEE